MQPLVADGAPFTAAPYHRLMSDFVAEPALLPPADEPTVRRHGDELRNLAARYGTSALRFASPGRLVGFVTGDRDAFDTADFEIAAGRYSVPRSACSPTAC